VEGGSVMVERRMEGREDGRGEGGDREGLPPLEWRSGYAPALVL